MKTKTLIKGFALGATMAAGVAASSTASAGIVGYELNINNPVFNTGNGVNNVPDIRLENTSQAITNATITDFTLTIGNLAFNFDFVRNESAVTDGSTALVFTRITPDATNDNVGPDQIDYDFTGFNIGDIFQFEVDVDPDVGEVVQDYRSILFPDSLLTVTFSNGKILSQNLNPSNIGQDGYTFAQSMEVSEPATLALFGGFALAGAALRRRSRAQR